MHMSRSKPFTVGIDASRANRLQRTGVEWYAFHLIQRLKPVIPSEYRVILYSEEPLRDGLEALPPNWESRVLRWPPRRLWTQLRLSWEMLARPPKLLFVPAYVPPMLTPRRTITTLHDTAFVTMPAAYSRIGRAYLKLMYRVAIHAGRILTVSEFSKGELVRLFGADPEKVDVTPLAADSALYVVAREEKIAEVLKRHRIDRPYFLFVGRLETKKNLGGLLAAFNIYRKTHPHDDARLVLIGRPGHGFQKEMSALMDDFAAHVIRPGYVASEDMAALYSGATAFVFVSLYEGFGIPLLEAFACGVPVIASDVTSIPEVADDAVLYVNPDDHDEIAKAMIRVADDAALRESLRQKGFARVKNFSWDKTAARTWEVMKRVIGGD
jgi:glycosyltransferase involved in cell wall biosynthesis